MKRLLKLDNIRVNKEEFHKSKQPINLDSINVNQIVICDKFKYIDDGFKYFFWLEKRWNCEPVMYYLTSNDWIHKIFWKWWQKHVFCN